MNGRDIRVVALFAVAVSTAAVAAVGCAPSDNGNPVFPSPTPTITLTPTPTPDVFVNPVTWKNGTELWLKVDSGITGTVDRVGALDTVSGFTQTVSPATSVKPNEHHTYLVATTGGAGVPDGLYRFQLDYTEPPSSQLKFYIYGTPLQFPTGGTGPFAGDPVASSVYAARSQTTGKMFLNFTGSSVVTLNEVHVYNSNGASIETCLVTPPYVTQVGGNTPDVCDLVPGIISGHNYRAILKGTAAAGPQSEFFQYVPTFLYQSNATFAPQ